MDKNENIRTLKESMTIAIGALPDEAGIGRTITIRPTGTDVFRNVPRELKLIVLKMVSVLSPDLSSPLEILISAFSSYPEDEIRAVSRLSLIESGKERIYYRDADNNYFYSKKEVAEHIGKVAGETLLKAREMRVKSNPVQTRSMKHVLAANKTVR